MVRREDFVLERLLLIALPLENTRFMEITDPHPSFTFYQESYDGRG